MPFFIPFIPAILGGASAIAGAIGLKKSVDARSINKDADRIRAQAKGDFEKAQSRLENQKQRTTESLEKLGEYRLRIESQLMLRFVDMAQQINQVSYRPITLGASQAQISPPELKAMELSSHQAADLFKDGVNALSSGVLVGVGAGGLASTIGVASTGTAISSLSGVAATNATLAWLGGGSLATASGLGVAGGATVLGGVIAGPALMVMGFSAASKAEKNRTAATQEEADIREAIEQMENGISVLSAIVERAEELRNVIEGVAKRFEPALQQAESAIAERRGQRAWLQAEADRQRAAYQAKSALSKFFSRLRGKKG
jgi:hypothetical protein